MLAIPRGTNFVEAQRLIDEECHNYENRILCLKMQRNTFTSIAKIPDEVLLEIFTTLESALKLVDLQLCITHVCRRWRWVVTQAPRLWTNLPTHNHNLTLLYLERSVPLGLNVDFSSRTSRDTTIAVLTNIQRIQALSLSGSADDAFIIRMQEILLRFGHEAPMLKALKVSLHPCGQARFKLLTSAFGRPLLLQKLCLRHIDFDWTMLPLPNLTTLDLGVMHMSSTLPWETLYKTLAAMPLLQGLSLRFPALQLRVLPHSIHPIWLPHLVTLHIADAFDTEALSFLSTIMMPSLEQMTIGHPFADHGNYTSVIRAILATIERGDFGTLDDLTFSKDNFFLGSSSRKSRKYIDYRHLTWWTGDAATQFINELLSGMSTPTADGNSVPTMVTVGLFSEPNTRIFETFVALPSLESMTIMEEMVIPFLNTLNIPTSAVEDCQLPFPNLKSIVFDADDSWDPEEPDFCELLEMLVDCMMQRCYYNAPIADLLIPWFITEDQLKSLKEVVVNVQIDYSA